MKIVHQPWVLTASSARIELSSRPSVGMVQTPTIAHTVAAAAPLPADARRLNSRTTWGPRSTRSGKAATANNTTTMRYDTRPSLRAMVPRMPNTSTPLTRMMATMRLQLSAHLARRTTPAPVKNAADPTTPATIEPITMGVPLSRPRPMRSHEMPHTASRKPEAAWT